MLKQSDENLRTAALFALTAGGLYVANHLILAWNLGESNTTSNLVRVIILPVLLACAAWLMPSSYGLRISKHLENSNSLLLAASMVSAYVVILCLLKFTKLATHHYALFDAGIYLNRVNQIVSATSLWEAISLSLFTTHFQPVILLPSLLAYMLAAPEAVFYFQTALFGVTGLLIYAIARIQIRSNGAALLCALIFYLLPSVQFFDILGFHPEAVAIPITLGSYILYLKNRVYLSILSMGSLILVNETLIPTFLFYCLFVHLSEQSVRKWLLITPVLLSLGVAALAVILSTNNLSYLSSLEAFLTRSPYSYLFSGNITTVMDAKSIVDRVLFLFLLLAPFLFLSLTQFRLLLIAVPDFGKLLLSADRLHHSIEGHYHGILLAIAFVAFIEFCRSRESSHGTFGSAKYLLTALAMTIGLSVGHSPMPWSYNFVSNASGGAFNFKVYLHDGETRSLDRIERIYMSNEGDGVSITDKAFFLSLAKERKLLLFPDLGATPVRLVILEETGTPFSGGETEQAAYQAAVSERSKLLEQEYTLVHSDGLYSAFLRKED